MPAQRAYEYIVIGLGGIGSAAAYWLARRGGTAVLGLEQFALGHPHGASADHSRIIQLSYHAPAYVALAPHAYAAWRALEHDAQEPLLVLTGHLYLAPADSALPLTDHMESMSAHQVPFERLDAAEVHRRWPHFHLAEDVSGVYQREGGLVPAHRGTALHQRLARRHGATLRDHTPVTAITALDDGAAVTTPDAVYHCRRVVLATDAWTNRLLAPLGVSIPLTLTQEQTTYFASPHLAEFRPGRFPVWTWRDDPCFYGLPVYGEEHGVKAAQDAGGRTVTLETRTDEPDPAMLARVGAFLQKTLPRAYGPVLYSKVCLYALTPDRDFVVGPLPAYPQIVLALGAGHGFKFAGLLGRILSELACTGATEYPIAPFAADRPSLTASSDSVRRVLLRR